MNNSVTIKDIAEMTQLSTSTVSRVINDSNLIPTKTKVVVNKAIENLGYRKRTISRQKKRAMLNIVIFLPDYFENSLNFLYNYPSLIAHIKNQSQSNPFNLITELKSHFSEFMKLHEKRSLDGIIFTVPPDDPSQLNILEEKGIPSITFNSVVENNHYICSDDYSGFTLMLKKIFQHRKNIQPYFINIKSEIINENKRFQAFKSACNDLNLSIKKEAVSNIETISDINYDLINQIRKNKSNAVFCYNDYIASAFIQTARFHRLSIPEEVTVCGFGSSVYRDVIQPRPATISIPTSEYSKNISRWIEKKIIKKEPGYFQKMISGKYLPSESF